MQMGQSFIRPLQERDSVLIADQLFYGFEIAQVEEGTRFAFPQTGDTLKIGRAHSELQSHC